MKSVVPLPPADSFPSLAGRTRWPWVDEISPSSQNHPNYSACPRITIITPSFNQVKFIEETIRSVLLQGYANLEYIIIDGGSDDGSVDIIKKYADRLTYWVSEKDRGQAHAINKGLRYATGDVIAYLNSDDFYLPGALQQIAKHCGANPEIDLIHGRCRYVDMEGNQIGAQFGSISTYPEILDLWDVWWKKRQFVQPEVFWTRRIFDRIGFFREDLHWVMDYEYWTRILRAGGRVERVDAELACFRFQANQKSTQPQRTADELLDVVRPFIWEKNSMLSPGQRLQLQAKWLFDAVFTKEAARSVTEKQLRLRRWIRLATLVCRYPVMVIVPEFRRRARNAVYFWR